MAAYVILPMIVTRSLSISSNMRMNLMMGSGLEDIGSWPITPMAGLFMTHSIELNIIMKRRQKWTQPF